MGEGAAEAWAIEREGAVRDILAWRCAGAPAVGVELPHVDQAETDPELELMARRAERVIGAQAGVFERCPFECLMVASEWVAELTTAVSLAVDWHVPMGEVLGRELTAADVQGLDALKRAQGACWRRDQEIERQRREIEAAKQGRSR